MGKEKRIQSTLLNSNSHGKMIRSDHREIRVIEKVFLIIRTIMESSSYREVKDSLKGPENRSNYGDIRVTEVRVVEIDCTCF